MRELDILVEKASPDMDLKEGVEKNPAELQPLISFWLRPKVDVVDVILRDLCSVRPPQGRSRWS